MCDKNKFKTRKFFPGVVVYKEFILVPYIYGTSSLVSEIYTASTYIKQRTTDGARKVIIGSRTIMGYIFLLSNIQSAILCMFECMCQMLIKFNASLKLKKLIY